MNPAFLPASNIQGRHEVDFVVASGRDCLAIEVKAASRWTERDLAGLHAFLERTPRCRAAIMAYNGEQAVRLGDKLWAGPCRWPRCSADAEGARPGRCCRRLRGLRKMPPGLA